MRRSLPRATRNTPEQGRHGKCLITNHCDERKVVELMTKDPMCGMNVDEATAVHADRDGKTLYFCSDNCRQKFMSGSAHEKLKDTSGGCCS